VDQNGLIYQLHADGFPSVFLDVGVTTDLVVDFRQNGRFAKEWSKPQETAGPLLERVCAARQALPLAVWERNAREALGIAAEPVAESSA